MKKILFAFLTLAGILSSCTNDDIEVTYATSIKVDPSSVLSTFTYEINPGELTMFDTEYKLRITVLAYNESGMLVNEGVTYCDNYNQIATTNMNLPAGNFTIYAITDVMNEEIEFWLIKNKERLATTQVVDFGRIGGKNKILGIATSEVNISADKSNECSLKPEAAGALCVLLWKNIHYFNGVTQYTLSSTKTSSYIQFSKNNKSGYEASELSNNGFFDWILNYVSPEYHTGDNIYDYNFVLPMGKVGFEYEYDTESIQYEKLTNTGYVTFEKGGEYLFALDLNNETTGGITYTYGIPLNNVSSAKPSNSMQKWFKNNDASCAYLSDLAKTSK